MDEEAPTQVAHALIVRVELTGSGEVCPAAKPATIELGMDAPGIAAITVYADSEDGSEVGCRFEPARSARIIDVPNHDGDCATGHSECGGCHGSVDPYDRFCRHCGASLHRGRRG